MKTRFRTNECYILRKILRDLENTHLKSKRNLVDEKKIVISKYNITKYDELIWTTQ